MRENVILRRSISVIACLIVINIAFVFSTIQSDAAVVDSGKCGDNLTWTLTDKGTLTIKGTGAMYDEQFKNCSDVGINKVVIESGATSIGSYCFNDCESIKSFTMADTITEIGEESFCDLDLTNFVFSKNLKTIGVWSFISCKSDETVVLPDSLEFIGFASLDFIDLDCIIVPKDVSYIGNSCLLGVKKIVVSTDNKYYCSVDGALYTKDKTELKMIYIKNTSKEVIIKSPAKKINRGAICTRRIEPETIVLPSGVTTLESFALYWTGTNIYVPSTVTDIGEDALNINYTIYVDKDSYAMKYCADNGYTYKVVPVSQSLSVKDSFEKPYGSSSFSLNAKAKNKLTYTSSNTDVASVSSTGKVTINGIGTAYITVKAADNWHYKSATKKVTVKVGKGTQKITTGADSYGKTCGCSAFSLYAKAKTKLTYSSSNKAVAVVSSTGKVTVKAPGTAIITVKAASGTKYKSATKKVTVKAKLKKVPTPNVSKVASSKVKVSWSKVSKAGGYQIYVKRVSDGKVIQKNTTDAFKIVKGITKGKSYKVKVRAYKTVSGNKVYGAWSLYRTYRH